MAVPSKRIAVVTGGNKGIGFAICRALQKQNPTIHVVLAARSESLGKDAVNALQQENPQQQENIEYAPLDLTEPSSAARLASWLKDRHKGIDILINNAGMAWKGDAFDENVARTTLGTNYFGTLSVMQELLPIVRDGGRVVNVCSFAGVPSRVREDVRKQFLAPSISLDKLNSVMNSFIEAVKDGTYAEKGWPKQTYSVSKIGETVMGNIFAREESYRKRGILILSVNPGWVKTDMAGPKAPLTIDQGAETPVFSALLPPDTSVQTGSYLSDKKVVDWEKM